MAATTRVADGYARVASRLASVWGINVVTVPGWRTRGRPGHHPRGGMQHHTAGSVRGGRTASLGVVTHGRPGLQNLLSQWYTPRDGTRREVYLVGAGLAWHAGVGSWAGRTDGNTSFWGNEIENDGVGEAFTAWQTYIAVAIAVEMAIEFGYLGGVMTCGHFEWALPRGRKVDPRGWDMARHRAEVAAGRPRSSGPSPAVPVHPGHMTIGEFMATLSPDQQRFLDRASALAVREGIDGQSMIRQWYADHVARRDAGWTAADDRDLHRFAAGMRSMNTTPAALGRGLVALFRQGRDAGRKGIGPFRLHRRDQIDSVEANVVHDPADWGA